MKSKNNKKIILIAILIISILLIITLIVLNSAKKSKRNVINSNDSNTVVLEEKTEEEKEEELMDKLKSVSESERIKTYLGIYFKYIEDKDYESAYNLLYPEFKANYFPSISDYKKYIENEAYSEKLAINYNAISMQGEYYVVELEVGDFLNTKKVPSQKTFMVKENNYNDFYLSFKK